MSARKLRLLYRAQKTAASAISGAAPRAATTVTQAMHLNLIPFIVNSCHIHPDGEC